MLYEKIKMIADGQHMSIRQLEQRAGLANGTIGKWRSAKKPNVFSVKKVADTLGVDMAVLLGDTLPHRKRRPTTK